jgi:uncharacterized phage protein (TIGR02218 family)
MPRVISSGLAAHVQGSTTTLAWLYKLTRRDSTILGLTSHDQDLEVDSVTYSASTASSPGTLQAELGSSVDSSEISGLLSDERITDEELMAGLYDGALVEVFLANWADLTQGLMPVMTAWIGEVSSRPGGFTAELRGLTQAARAVVGRRLTTTCQVKEFGDAECGFNLATKTWTSEVTSSTGRRLFTATSLIGRTEQFAFGKVTWTTGPNAGSSQPCASLNSTTGEVALMIPAPHPVSAGDDFTISAGCDRSLAACQGYGNVVNFQGFPTVPGPDAVIRGPKT